MVTIKDIAKKAKVSMSTVSHVINKTHYVSPDLKKKIVSTMEKLDDDPNLIASSLRSKKTKKIGLILPEISDLLISELAKSLEKILGENNYNIIISNSEDDKDKEANIIRILSNRMIDGLLIMPAVKSSIDIKKLNDKKIPIVFLDRKILNLKINSVIIDNERGCFEAAEYLIGQGHKLIAYITQNSGTTTSISREKGFRKALESNGIKIRKDFYKR